MKNPCDIHEEFFAHKWLTECSWRGGLHVPMHCDGWGAKALSLTVSIQVPLPSKLCGPGWARELCT